MHAAFVCLSLKVHIIMFVLVMALMCVWKEVRDKSTMLAKIQLRAFDKVAAAGSVVDLAVSAWLC